MKTNIKHVSLETRAAKKKNARVAKSLKHVRRVLLGGAGEQHTHTRAFPGIISARNVFLGGPPHMRCRELRRKGAQTRAGAKQWESAQTHARGGAPGNHFSPECFLGGGAAYAIPVAGVEGGANARAGEVAEKHANACPVAGFARATPPQEGIVRETPT